MDVGPSVQVELHLLRLLQNTTTLSSALQELGFEDALDLVQIQFLHPVEGLVTVVSAPLTDTTAAQIVANGADSPVMAAATIAMQQSFVEW